MTPSAPLNLPAIITFCSAAWALVIAGAALARGLPFFAVWFIAIAGALAALAMGRRA